MVFVLVYRLLSLSFACYAHTISIRCACIVCQLLNRTASLATIYTLFFSRHRVNAFTKYAYMHIYQHARTSYKRAHKLSCWGETFFFFSFSSVLFTVLYSMLAGFFFFLYLFGRHSIWMSANHILIPLLYTNTHTKK